MDGAPPGVALPPPSSTLVSNPLSYQDMNPSGKENGDGKKDQKQRV